MRYITTSFAPPGQASQFQRDYIGPADIIDRSLPRFLTGLLFIVVVDDIVGRNEATSEDLIENKTVKKCSGGTARLSQ